MGILDAPAAARTIGKRLTKNISGSSNVTLTAAEAQYRHVDLVSATQTITITVPTGARFLLTNSTDYAQTIKKAGATGTASVDPNGRAEVTS